MIASSQSDRIASATDSLACRCVRGAFIVPDDYRLASSDLKNVAWAAEPSKTDAAIEDRVQGLIPDIEAYITSGMKEFDVPGLAIGIVAGDKLIYAKGFGVRSKSSSVPVDTRTISRSAQRPRHFSLRL